MIWKKILITFIIILIFIGAIIYFIGYHHWTIEKFPIKGTSYWVKYYHKGAGIISSDLRGIEISKKFSLKKINNEKLYRINNGVFLDLILSDTLYRGNSFFIFHSIYGVEGKCIKFSLHKRLFVENCYRYETISSGRRSITEESKVWHNYYSKEKIIFHGNDSSLVTQNNDTINIKEYEKVDLMSETYFLFDTINGKYYYLRRTKGESMFSKRSLGY
jgi:hypothetical protein